MINMKNDIKIEHHSRQVIENRLLTALEEDDSKVAILCNREDLELIISGLVSLRGQSNCRPIDRQKADEFVRNLDRLLVGAFQR